MIFALVQDFAATLAALPARHPRQRVLALLEEAVRRDVHFVARHPTALFQCLWNSCWWHDCPEAAGHYATPGHPPTEPDSEGNDEPARLFRLLAAWRRQKEERQAGFAWLRSLRPPPIPLDSGLRAVLRGHEAEVTSVACSPDGRRIASGSKDETVRVWDAESGKELLCLRAAESEEVASVAYSPDGRRIASGSDTGPVRVWDAETGRPVHSLLEGDLEDDVLVQCVAYSPDGGAIFSASGFGTISVWDARTGRRLRQQYLNEGAKSPRFPTRVNTVALSPDGRRVVSGSGDRLIQVWDADSGREVRCGGVSPGWLMPLSLGCKVGLALLVAGGLIGLTDLVGLTDLRGLRLTLGGIGLGILVSSVVALCIWLYLAYAGSAVNGVAYAPDGRQVASAHEDGTVCLWDAETGQELRRLTGHTGPARSVAYSPDGRCLASGSQDATVRVWDTHSGRELHCFAGEDEVHIVAYSPDGRGIASATKDLAVRVWRASGGRRVRRLRGHEGTIVGWRFSPDGRQVATESQDGTTHFWDSASGRELHCLRGYGGGRVRGAYSPDGRQYMTGAQAGPAVGVFDAATGRELHRLFHHLRRPPGCVHTAAYSPDGRRIASGSGDGTVRVWDAHTGQEIRCLCGGEFETVFVLAWSPDGRTIVAGSQGGQVRVWDAETGQCLESTRTDDNPGIPNLVVRTSRRLAPDGPAADQPAWEGTRRPTEVGVQVGGSGEDVAWFPVVLYLERDSSGRIWAGTVGRHLYLLTLESGRE